MSEGIKVPYSEAAKIASDLLVLLQDHFERLEIAGSLRRKKELIGDIELVGILRTVKGGLFGFNEITPTGAILELMRRFGYKASKAGEKYIKLVSNRKMNVDLFLCTPETWGCIFLIRTGSAEFTRKIVTKKTFRGWCPDNMNFYEGRLWRDGVVLETPEEMDVFRELGLAFVPPEQRSL